MSKLVRTIAATLLICLSAVPVPSWAAKGDCSQPVTNGSNPTASDCLFILKTAVGSQTCGNKPCICDTGGAAGVTASDALLCLQKAVDPTHVVVTCRCGVTTTSTSTSSTTSSSTTTSTTLVAPKLEGSAATDEDQPATAPASARISISADGAPVPVVLNVGLSPMRMGAHGDDGDVCSLPQS